MQLLPLLILPLVTLAQTQFGTFNNGFNNNNNRFNSNGFNSGFSSSSSSKSFQCQRTVGGPKFDRRCRFPFIFRGKEYNGCTRLTDPDNRLWCSTKVDFQNNHVGGGKGNWGYCDDSCREDFGVEVSNNTQGVGRDSGRWLPDPDSHEECGVNLATKFVVGGDKAQVGQFPFLALMGYRSSSSRTGTAYFCGGSLINRRYVLTAAHCHHRTLRSAQIREVVLGEYTVGKDNDCFGCLPPQRYNIGPDDVTMHEDYRARSVQREGNDIALVRLPSLAITQNENSGYNVMPLCLPWKQSSRPSDTSGIFHVAGWGKATQIEGDRGNIPSHGVFELTMLFARLPIVSHSRCSRELDNIHRTRHVCAGGDPGIDSCNGDSGGPLFGQKTNDGPYIMRGIVSFGTSVCGIGAPGVYTDVYNYMDWIRRNMRP